MNTISNTTTNSLAHRLADKGKEEEDGEQESSDEHLNATIPNIDNEMPVDFVILYKGVPLKLIWDKATTHTLPKTTETLLVKRLCTISTATTTTNSADKCELLLLLTTNQQLFSGYFQLDNYALELKFHMFDIVDVDYCCRTQQIFVVNNKGEVLLQQMNGALKDIPNDWLKLVFDPLELNETGIHITRVCCAAESALFLSDAGDTYGWGNCGEILVANTNGNNQPKQVRLYEQNKLQLIQMAAGDDFFVLLLRPRLTDCAAHLPNVGKNLLQTQLHTFGAINNGLLGIGDHMRRNNVQHLSKMDGLGVHEIQASREQALALLLDGRVFKWGSGELSTPTETILGRSILTAQCSYNDILVMKAEQRLLPLSKSDMQSATVTSALLASGCFCVYNNCLPQLMQQTELRDAIMTTQTLLKQLLIQCLTLMSLQHYLVKHQPQHSLIQLCQQFEQLLHLHAAFLSGILDWCLGRSQQLTLLQHIDTALQHFRLYTQTYCNLLAWNQFTSQIAAFQAQQTQQLQLDMGLLQFLPQTLNVAYMRVLQPLQARFPLCNEALSKLRTFATYHRLQVKLAEQTLRFWLPKERHSKLSKLSDQLERRVLLSSYEVPLKLTTQTTSLLGGNHVFILCNDAFFHLSGSTLQRYALKTLWLKNKNVNSFCIVTPEITLMLSTRELDEKQRWWQELQQILRQELGHNNSINFSSGIANVRLLSYKFSANHALYAQVLAVGQWRDGLMHGICHLEYPSGKFYSGQVRYGHIDGKSNNFNTQYSVDCFFS